MVDADGARAQRRRHETYALVQVEPLREALTALGSALSRFPMQRFAKAARLRFRVRARRRSSALSKRLVSRGLALAGERGEEQIRGGSQA